MNERRAARVLIAEDDDNIATLVREQLEFESYATERVSSGRSAIEKLESATFDLVVLDLGLPDQNGFEVCQVLRERGISTPLLVLTARDETADKVRALDMGADDYVTKPFEAAELLARVRALLRRRDSQDSQAKVLQVGDLRVDQRKHRVMKGDEEISLTAREFDLLTFLLSHAGEVVSRDSLLEHLWPGIYVTPRTVDVHVAALRKKLEADPKAPTLIVGVRGVGYRFEDGTN